MATSTDKPIEVIIDIVQRALASHGITVPQGSSILKRVRADLLPPPPHPLDSVATWLEQSNAPVGVQKDLAWAYQLISNTNPAPSPVRDAGELLERVEPRIGGAPMPATLFKDQNNRWYAQRELPYGANPTVEGVGSAPLEALYQYVNAWTSLQDAARRMVETT